MTFLGIAMLFFLAALVVFAIDLMIPTGGVLIAVTSILGITAIYFAFRHSPTSGWWMLLAALGTIPVMLIALLYLWPKTPFGKMLIAKPDKAKEFVWSDASESDDPKALVGKIGLAQTEFLPHGTVLIDQREFEAVSEAGPIEPGTSVRVTKLDVGRLVVIPWRNKLGSNEPMSRGSSLDRPSDELGLDSLQ
ncbi:MAG: NfeD family protein [Planctomycetota bacterium]|jgi:membrane-bound ClpP family serine protease